MNDYDLEQQLQDIQSFLKDAVFLQSNGRHKGALLLLLCCIDGLSKLALPAICETKTRYCSYLRDLFNDMMWWPALRFDLRDPKHASRQKYLEEVLYEYLRCRMVHECTTLTASSAPAESVSIDWSGKAAGFTEMKNGAMIVDGIDLCEFIYRACYRGICKLRGLVIVDEHRPSTGGV